MSGPGRLWRRLARAWRMSRGMPEVWCIETRTDEWPQWHLALHHYFTTRDEAVEHWAYTSRPIMAEEIRFTRLLP